MHRSQPHPKPKAWQRPQHAGPQTQSVERTDRAPGSHRTPPMPPRGDPTELVRWDPSVTQHTIGSARPTRAIAEATARTRHADPNASERVTAAQDNPSPTKETDPSGQ